MLAQLVSQKLQGSSYHLLPERQFLSSDAARLETPSVAVMNSTAPMVGTACLELAPQFLHQQIEGFGKQAIASGYKRLQIVPLFLLPGVHVMEDIPAEIAQAQKAFGSDLTLDLRPHLGSHSGLGRLLAFQRNSHSADAWILLSHGSRRSAGNHPVETLAAQLNATPAYWSVPPSLEARVKQLVSHGYRKIGILPYFLFPGGITDAIAQTVELLSQQFPVVELKLAKPMGASTQLADIILDLTLNKPGA